MWHDWRGTEKNVKHFYTSYRIIVHLLWLYKYKISLLPCLPDAEIAFFRS